MNKQRKKNIFTLDKKGSISSQEIKLIPALSKADREETEDNFLTEKAMAIAQNTDISFYSDVSESHGDNGIKIIKSDIKLTERTVQLAYNNHNVGYSQEKGQIRKVVS